jgi:tetratricopeptide (TPR) repeat protein
MKNKLLIPIVLLAALQLLGCKKYLEVKSDAKLVIPFSITDAQALLDDNGTVNLQSTPSYGESSADDYFLPPTAIAAKGLTSVDVYLWKYTDYRYGNDWSKAYLPIYNSNLCLEILDKVEQNQSNLQSWRNTRGSALFIRSYFFYMLAVQFGLAYNENTSTNDLGIVLRKSSDFNIQSVRSSVKLCFEQIVSDLEEAVPLLDNYSRTSLRPSKGAALALLARVYLYMHRYDMALKSADEALKLNPQLMDFNGDPEIAALSAAVPFKRFNKETIFYSELFFGFDVHGTGAARIDTLLYGQYAAADLRKTAYFKANGNFQQFKGSYAANATTFFSGLATDELYLTRAECRAFLNDVDGGMADLNTLLKKRYLTTAFVPLSASSKDEALVKIRQERRKELLMRGLRWGDIKRLNAEGAGIVLRRIKDGNIISLIPGSQFYALPLPTDVVQLSGIPQN